MGTTVGDLRVDVKVGGSASVNVDEVDLHCFGSWVMSFEPGLTEDPSPQTITGYMNGGTELSPTNPCSRSSSLPYKGLSIGNVKLTGELACTANRGTLGKIEGTAEILWDNGDESTIDIKGVSYGALPVLEMKVTGGDADVKKGATIYQDLVPTIVTGKCGESPVMDLGSSGVADIIDATEK